MLGENIKKLRKEHKISQEALAEKLGVSRQSISLWENGNTMPSMENIVIIANVFGVSTDALLNDEPTHNTNSTSEAPQATETTPKPKRKIGKTIPIVISIVLALTIITTGVLLVINKLADNKNKELSAEEIFSLISPSTVEIHAKNKEIERTGTGCFIDTEGTIVTNYHVIENCNKIEITTYDGKTHKVKSVLGFDKERDLVILKTDYKNKTSINFRSDKIKTGERAYTLGSSLGLTGTFSEGIISSASREIDGFEYIQTTAPISSGNSGGPLVDCYGNVVGITSCAFIEGQNLNLAIPISYVNEISRDDIYSVKNFYLLYKDQSSEQDKDDDKDKDKDETLTEETANELVYNWLIENGELMDGNHLYYAFEKSPDCIFEITSYSDKKIDFSIIIKSPVYYKISFDEFFSSTNEPLLRCRILDETETGKSSFFKHDKSIFTKNTPISKGDSSGVYINGDFHQEIIIRDGKYTYEIFALPAEEIKYIEIEKDAIDRVNVIDGEFSVLAHKGLCLLLDFINNDMSDSWGFSISDLGYKKYKP